MQAGAVGAPVAAKLKKASQDIEAIFMKDLLTAMRKTSPHKSMGSNFGSDMYMDLIDQAISQDAAKSGTLGIGKTIYSQMAPLAIQTAIRNAAAAAPVLASVPPVSIPGVSPVGSETPQLTTGAPAKAQTDFETEKNSTEGHSPAVDKQRP